MKAWPESRAVSPLAAMRGSGGSFGTPTSRRLRAVAGQPSPAFRESVRRRRLQPLSADLFRAVDGTPHKAPAGASGCHWYSGWNAPFRGNRALHGLCGRCVKGPCWIHGRPYLSAGKPGRPLRKYWVSGPARHRHGTLRTRARIGPSAVRPAAAVVRPGRTPLLQFRATRVPTDPAGREGLVLFFSRSPKPPLAARDTA